MKFNDYFEFPNEIDMQPYTDKGMEKMEKGELLEENKGKEDRDGFFKNYYAISLCMACNKKGAVHT